MTKGGAAPNHGPSNGMTSVKPAHTPKSSTYRLPSGHTPITSYLSSHKKCEYHTERMNPDGRAHDGGYQYVILQLLNHDIDDQHSQSRSRRVEQSHDKRWSGTQPRPQQRDDLS